MLLLELPSKMAKQLVMKETAESLKINMNFPGKILQPFGKIYQTQILDIYSDIKKIKLPLHSSRK